MSVIASSSIKYKLRFTFILRFFQKKMILCTELLNKQFSNNTFQTPDSKKDKSLTPKTPKVPLSLEEIKAKMQASIDKVSFLTLQVSSALFIILVQQKNVGKKCLHVTACSLVSRVN